MQRPVYSVAENISLDNLVLRVCVEGSNLADQTYNVQLHTEEADTNSALGEFRQIVALIVRT